MRRPPDVRRATRQGGPCNANPVARKNHSADNTPSDARLQYRARCGRGRLAIAGGGARLLGVAVPGGST